jgi:acrylyl-CoA reductase (NADPH)
VAASTGRVNESSHLTALGATEIIVASNSPEPANRCRKNVGQQPWTASAATLWPMSARASAMVAQSQPAASLKAWISLPPSPRSSCAASAFWALTACTCLAPLDEAWNRLAKELPETLLADNTTEISLRDVGDVAVSLLKGEIRGRLLVDVNRKAATT